ncbi:hypothetical protein KR018_000991, partial [Drosophila ironensis]
IGKIRYIRNRVPYEHCTGIAIDRRHVLAPAHCVYWLERNSEFGFMGANPRRGHRISKIFIHPKYKLEYPSFDIAVLKTRDNLNCTLPLAGQVDVDSVIDRRLDVVGYVGDSNKAQTQAKIAGHEYCQSKFSGFEVTENEICGHILLAGMDLKGAALLVTENGSATWHLLGMSTHGGANWSAENPDLFTLIPPYKKWIEEI